MRLVNAQVKYGQISADNISGDKLFRQNFWFRYYDKSSAFRKKKNQFNTFFGSSCN